jgi:hypothetical protein
MPISAEKRKLYPKNWKEIRAAILERACNCCEECGVRNHAYGARDKDGDWHDANDIASMSCSTGEALWPEYPTEIKIVLTIAHLNHDVTDNRPANLKALCQKHHLALDKELHIANAKVTWQKKKLAKQEAHRQAIGQLLLLERE